MAILPTAVWRVRVGGDDSNGAGFDSTISGAGVDYSQQDAAQLSLTDIACAASTTVTSVTGGFTSNMIGNAIRITGGGADDGYYFITARSNTNTITVDRSPGTVVAGNGNVGGAAAIPSRLHNSANADGDKVIPGNIIYVRGSGSNNPVVADYSEGSYYVPVAGNTTEGFVSLIGENGRPLISTQGLQLYTIELNYLEALCYQMDAASFGDNGILFSSGGNRINNVRFDGNSQTNVHGVNLKFGDVIANSFITNARIGINADNYGVQILSCEVSNGLVGIDSTSSSSGYTAIGNLVHDCTFGLHVTAENVVSSLLLNNTIYNNSDDAIVVETQAALAFSTIMNNIISDNPGNGLRVVTGSADQNDRMASFIDYNDYFNNGTDRVNISASSNDKALDPQFTNPGSNDFSIGTNLADLAFPLLDIGAARSYVDIGAFQRQASSPSGGGLLTHPGMSGGMRG